MSADDDKLKPANPPKDGEIDLPLPTDWHPGSSVGGGSTRRVTGTQHAEQSLAAGSPHRNEADPNVYANTFSPSRDEPVSAPTSKAQPEASSKDVITESGAPHVVLSPRPVNPDALLTIKQQSGGRKVCPKCGHPNANLFSCDRCGLVFSRWKPEMERAEYAEVLEPVLLRARVLWREVEIAQTAEARQEAVTAFHDFCEASKAESFASVRYRIWLGSHPDDEAVRKGQQRILSRAQFMLPAQTGPTKNQIGPLGLMMALVITLILTGFLTVFFLNVFGSGQ
jgi:hypothetical protein